MIDAKISLSIILSLFIFGIVCILIDMTKEDKCEYTKKAKNNNKKLKTEHSWLTDDSLDSYEDS